MPTLVTGYRFPPNREIQLRRVTRLMPGDRRNWYAETKRVEARLMRLGFPPAEAFRLAFGEP